MYSSIGLVLIALTVLMMGVHAFLLGQKVGMHARIIATSAIYQKVGRRGGWRREGREESERREGRSREDRERMGGRSERWKRG